MPRIITFPHEWMAFLLFLAGILFFISLAEFSRKILRWTPETTRKLVHVLIGVLLAFAPFVLTEAWPAIVLSGLFIVINYFTIRNELLKGMHATKRLSYGTVYFPIAFLILVLVYWERCPPILLTAMVILTFADTAATLVGERYGPATGLSRAGRTNSGKRFTLWVDRKSIPGSIAFFIVTLAAVMIAFPSFNALFPAGSPLPLHAILLMAVLTALMSTLAEAASRQGSDNLSLTLSAALMMDLTIWGYARGTIVSLMSWMAFSMLLAYGAYRLRSLTAGGAVGAFILGVFMFSIGGWATMLPLTGFFVLSTTLSKFADRNRTKDAVTLISAKGSNRDIVQVFSNGGVALAVSIIWFWTRFHHDWLYFAFLASLAAATADTWETEIGGFARSLPRSILHFHYVPRGTSGGITALGTAGGFAGAILITLIGLPFLPGNPSSWTPLLVAACGFLGSIVDSLLGASIQAKFRCTVCGKDTEKRVHCNQATRHTAGLERIDNDWVNLACTASGALIFMALYYSFT